MKNTMFLLALFLSAAMASAQTMENSKERYMQKSIKQKRAAWILLAGGTSMVLAGSIIGDMDNSEQLGYGANFEVGMWLAGTGLAAGVVSVPLFLSASKNRRMAVAVTLKNQPQLVIRNGRGTFRLAPAAALAIRL